MASATETTLYTPLDSSGREIRLLILTPSDSNDHPVSCQLKTSSLTPDLEYAALSYVWGDAHVTETIVVNGVPFEATTNLVSALWNFRKDNVLHRGYENAALPLWVDALCINQKDIDERSQQLILMTAIYSGAKFVFTWLGTPGIEHEDVALRSMRDMAKSISSFGTRYFDTDDPDDLQKCFDVLLRDSRRYFAQHPELCRIDTHVTSLLQNTTWTSILFFCRLPYWQRLWVIQEMVLAKSWNSQILICGQEQLTYQDVDVFFKVFFLLKHEPGTPDVFDPLLWGLISSTIESPLRVVMSRHLKQVHESGVSEPALAMNVALSCQTSNPRDMVYGLLALLNLKIQPDYKYAVKKVYLEWFDECLRRRKQDCPWEEMAIRYTGVGLQRSINNEHNLPTWLCDLSRVLELKSQVILDTRYNPASWLSFPLQDVRVSTDGVLSLYGVVCDRVTGLMRLGSSVYSHRDIFQKICVLLAVVGGKLSRPTGLPPLQALYYSIWQGTDYRTGQPQEIPASRHSIHVQAFRFSYLFDLTDGQPQSPFKALDADELQRLRLSLDSCFLASSDAFTRRLWLETLSPLMGKMPLVSGSVTFHNQWQRYLRKSLFWTEKGYIGFAPQGAHIGDTVCVLDNCTLPILLRRHGEGWVNVGACYAHGLSDREPVVLERSGRLKLRRFDIY